MSDIEEKIARLRRDYASQPLHKVDLASDPLAQFQVWFDEALHAGLAEPNAMTLSTADPSGEVSSRIVLLKDVDDAGLIFFTNYASRKGRELDANPHAALLFFWPELHRQVKVRGRVEQTSRERSEAYFHSRPLKSQLGAWASIQSSVIPDRPHLEARYAELGKIYQDQVVPLPDEWGGYRVIPTSVEFWQGRPSRLHDRIAYHRDGDTWVKQRLSP
ncbi:MAG: pyridoxamine 5'-phosphate oxidase [Kiritimatiellia bacterium]|jgi:pyridoxamine 5'-phosphate oxidase